MIRTRGAGTLSRVGNKCGRFAASVHVALAALMTQSEREGRPKGPASFVADSAPLALRCGLSRLGSCRPRRVKLCSELFAATLQTCGVRTARVKGGPAREHESIEPIYPIEHWNERLDQTSMVIAAPISNAHRGGGS